MKIHLAELDARDAFLKLEPAIDKAAAELEHMAKDAAHATTNAATFTLDSLAASLRQIRARLPK